MDLALRIIVCVPEIKVTVKTLKRAAALSKFTTFLSGSYLSAALFCLVKNSTKRHKCGSYLRADLISVITVDNVKRKHPRTLQHNGTI